MFKKTLYLVLLITAVVGTVESGLFDRGLGFLKDSAITEQLKESVQSSELLPGPLRGSFDAGNTVLTRAGIVEETNRQRELNGLVPLHKNERLNKAAEKKLDDMFAQQYFEHNSPDGKTPADVIKSANYEYIIVGENLALGNFKNDELLIDAWMNSPGHRANILHSKFNEIGAAAKKGMFEGREVWLAVQEFGTPLSSCPSPTAGLQDEITANRNQIEQWQTELSAMKKRIDSSKYSSNEAYESEVEKYNALAVRTNKLVDETRVMVEQYNSQVKAFNICLDANV